MEDEILNDGDLLEGEDLPEICDCGECEECIKNTGECTCGDCDVCLAGADDEEVLGDDIFESESDY